MPDYEIRSIPRQDTAVVAVTSPLDGISESMGKAFEKTFHALGESGVDPAGPSGP